MTTVAENDIVQALFECAKPLDKKFNEIIVDEKSVYLYPDPFRVERSDLVTTDGTSLVRDGDVVHSLTAEEEFALLGILSEKMGFPIRHPYLSEQFEAAYSAGAEEFQRNVQTPYWARTGQLIAVNDGAYIRRILGIKTPDNITGHLIVPDRTLPNGYRATGIPIPTKTGFFSSLSGPIPTDNDIVPSRPNRDRLGYWNGNNPDDEGLSAVGVDWNSDGWRLRAGAYRPLDRYSGGVLGMATETPLK